MHRRNPRLLKSAPGQAASPPQNGLSDAAKAMIGTWEFSNADHDRICHFTFRTDAATGGYKLDIDKNCPNLFPSTANIVAWSLDNYGDLRLLDADGKEVVELSEVEGGMYDGFTPEEGRYILQTAAAAPTLTAADMVGDWAVARGAGKPICVLTLANSPAGDALALTVKPGCDAFVMRFAPSAWRMDEGALVLLLGARAELAIRAKRRQDLATRAGNGQSDPAAAAVTDRNPQSTKSQIVK